MLTEREIMSRKEVLIKMQKNVLQVRKETMMSLLNSRNMNLDSHGNSF